MSTRSHLMLRGGDSGPVVVKGAANESLLLERVSASDAAERMPPEHEGEPLTAEQVALLRDWIAAGAPAPADERPEADPRDHWAFRPIVRPPVPRVQRVGWVNNPIDAFIAQRHEQHGLTPQPEASRTELLRRLSLDLIGLPPTPEEIAAFRSRRRAGLVRAGGRAPAGRPAARRALGAALDGHLALQRLVGAWATSCATARSTSGTGATGSSNRSTPTRPTTRWSG